MPTFIVERYLPGISRTEAEAVMAREALLAEEMTAPGSPIRVLHSTLVEPDETVMSVVEAPSEEHVVELGTRVGAPPDRVVAAVTIQPPAGESAT